MAEDRKVEVGRLGHGVGLRVVGPGSVQQGAAIYRTVAEVVAEGVKDVKLVLSDCTSIDSTFLGCMVQLHKEFNAGEQPHVRFSAPSEGVMRTLKSTGMHAVLPIDEAVADNQEEWHPLDLPDWGDSQMHRQVLKSHEALCEVDEKNKQVFGPIVEQLRRELHESE